MPQQPSQPPNHPPSNQHRFHNSTVPNHQQPLPCLSKPANLPDFLLTALSLFLFITAPKHHLPPRVVSLSAPPPSANRRFIRLTSTMSQNPNPNPNSRAFPTPQSLTDWLKPRIPSDSLASWGTKPGTKNIHNLWLELADGETSLVDEVPPIRNLEVVSVRILGDNNKVLIESHQQLSDGLTRKRNRPLSEKMKSGEDIEAAVKRAIKEELGSVIFKDGKDVNFDEIVRVEMGSYEKKVEERFSVSYPGLPACYVLHTVDAFVEGLPEGEFATEEETEYEGSDHGFADEAVSVKKHFWKWVPADSV